MTQPSRQRDPRLVSPSQEVRTLFAAVAVRHLHSVRAVVRAVLPDRLRRRLDSTDIVNDVYLSALVRPSLLPSEICSRRVVPFLKKAARLKVFDRYRHHTAQKRNLRQEAGADSLVDQAETSPRVENDLEDREQLEQIRDSLRDQERQVLDRLLAGEQQTVIADDLGISRGKVHRIINRIARREMMR